MSDESFEDSFSLAWSLEPDVRKERLHVELINRKGLHARAAAKFVIAANHYEAMIALCREPYGEGEIANAKDILSLIVFAAPWGDRFEIRAVGTDAEQAVLGLARLIQLGFQEV